MTDPQRHPADHPPRGQPLQPDKPGSGSRPQRGSGGAPKPDALHEVEEQERGAVDNAREGYD